jgi:TonB family protein
MLLASNGARVGAQDASRCTPPDTANWPAMQMAQSDSARLPRDVYLASQVDVSVRGGSGYCVSAILPSGAQKIFSEYAILEFIVNTDGSIERSSFKVLRATSRTYANYYANGPVGMGTFLPAELHGRRVRQLVQQATFLTKTSPEGKHRDSVVFVKGDSMGVRTYFEFQVEKPASSIGDGHPRYPAVLKGAKVEGTVLAQFVVLEDGSADMDTFKILRSSQELFSASAREFVERTRFKPAEIGGKKVRQLVQLPFEFRLRAGEGTRTDTAASGPILLRREGSSEIISVPRDLPKWTTIPISPSDSAHLPKNVFLPSQVDVPVRSPNGSVIPTEVPPELAAMFAGYAVLEFVTNADGTVDESTFKVLRATSREIADVYTHKPVGMYLLPAELHGKKVRQLVVMATPVMMKPRQ